MYDPLPQNECLQRKDPLSYPTPLPTSPPTQPPLSESLQDSRFPEHLIPLIPTRENSVDLLDKIKRTLSKMRLPPGLDRDNLAQDIWLEAWVGQKPVTSVLIRSRAINALHKLKGEIEVFDVARLDPDTTATNEQFETLLNSVPLDIRQLTIIHLVYDSGLTIKEIAESLKTSQQKVSDALHSAIQKLQAVARGMR